MSIATDSTPLEEPKDPEKCKVLALMRLVADEQEIADWESRYRAGGVGYGHSKKRLIELLTEYFKPYREKRAQLEKDPDYVEDVLKDGGQRAREIAQEVMEQVRQATGLKYDPKKL